MNITRLLTISILWLILILTGAVSAAEIPFEASANRSSVPLGQSIQLSLKFENSKSIPAPELPDIEGFNSRYVGPSTMMSIVNGRMSSAITHIYRLVPLKTGTFTVGPISFEHNNDNYVSNQLSLEVYGSSAGQSPSPQRQQKAQQASLSDRVYMTMSVAKSTAYINEIIPVTIKLYIVGLSVRDIQYPEFSHEGFSAETFGKPRQYKEKRGGIAYDVVEFNTSLFGTRPGKYSLGPATLTANLLLKRSRGRSLRDDFFGGDPFDNFFGRYETEPIEVQTEETAVTVLSIPEENRPPDFNGAIGNFSLDVTVSSAYVRSGDPVTVTSTVKGEGNLNTVTPPSLQNQENFKTYAPEIKQESNRKTFEQIIIPTTDQVKEIPKVVFSFFNPATGKYRTIARGPFPLTVTSPDKKEELTIMEAAGTLKNSYTRETLGRDIIYIKESPGRLRKKGGYLFKNPFFLLLQFIPLLLYMALMTLKKQRDRLSTDISYARRLKAPRKARKGIKEAEQHLRDTKTEEFYDTTFKTLREYIGNRFHISTGGITVDEVELLLKDRSLDGAILEKVKSIFSECDLARYAPAGLDAEKMGATLQDLKDVIDYLERTK